MGSGSWMVRHWFVRLSGLACTMPGTGAAGVGRAQPAGRRAAVPAGPRAAEPSGTQPPPPAAEARGQASHPQRAQALLPPPPALFHSCGGATAPAARAHVLYSRHGRAHAAAANAEQGGHGGCACQRDTGQQRGAVQSGDRAAPDEEYPWPQAARRWLETGFRRALSALRSPNLMTTRIKYRKSV